MMNKLEVKIMTKYLVKIYNCGKLEDVQILEETDKIQLADYYIQDNQLWVKFGLKLMKKNFITRK